MAGGAPVLWGQLGTWFFGEVQLSPINKNDMS